MSDLISRHVEAFLDIHGWIPVSDRLKKNGDFVFNAISDIHPLDCNAQAITEKIKELQSVQPDVPDTNVGDTISRQAAFEALCNAPSRCVDIDVCKKGDRYCAEGTKLDEVPSAQTEVIRCKNCRWWDKYNEKHGYCMAAKHGFMSSHWEISIYRTYDEDFFCADAEPKKKKGGDDEAD